MNCPIPDDPRAALDSNVMTVSLFGRHGSVTASGTSPSGRSAARRDDIKVVALEQDAVRCLRHRHRRVRGEQRHEQTVVGGIEMLNEDEGHAVAVRQSPNQLGAGFQASGRRADARHGQRGVQPRPEPGPQKPVARREMYYPALGAAILSCRLGNEHPDSLAGPRPTSLLTGVPPGFEARKPAE